MKNIKWTGNEETLIRKERGGEQFPVKPNGTIEVDEQAYEDLSCIYPDSIELVGGKKETVKVEVISRAVPTNRTSRN